jgi:hypothetical protein
MSAGDKLKLVTDEDEEWINSLNGKAKKNIDDLEISVLRDLLRKQDIALASKENIEQDWQKLRFSLKREMRSAPINRFFNVRYAQAAIVLLAMFGLYQFIPTSNPTSPSQGDVDLLVMRGKYTQDIFVVDPLMSATQMAEKLRQLNIPVVLNAKHDFIEIKVALTYPITKNVRELLESNQVRLPNEGDLYLIYSRSVK